MKKTTKIASLLVAATAVPLSSFAQSTNFKTSLNTIMNDYAIPIFIVGMVLGVFIGLLKNWDKIADTNGTGQKKEGIMNTVYMVTYVLLSIGIVYAIVAALKGMNINF